jgi:hypothetical protein
MKTRKKIELYSHALHDFVVADYLFNDEVFYLLQSGDIIKRGDQFIEVNDKKKIIWTSVSRYTESRAYDETTMRVMRRRIKSVIKKPSKEEIEYLKQILEI